MSRKSRQAKHIIKKSTTASFLELLVYMILCFQIIGTALYYNGVMHPLMHKLLLGQVLALSAWFLFGLYSISVRKVTFSVSPYYLPLLALTVWAGIRSFTAPNADAMRNYWVFFNLICTFPLWVTGFRYKYVRSLFLWSVVFCGICLVIGNIRQLTTVDPKFNWHFFKAITLSGGNYDRQRLGAFMGHNNDCSAYLAIAVIYAGILWIRYRTQLWSFALGIFILLALVMIYLGGSRGVALMMMTSVMVLLMGYGIYLLRTKAISGIKFKMPGKQWLIGGAVLLLMMISTGAFLTRAPLKEKEISGVIARFLSPPEHLVSGTYPRVWLMSLLMAKENPVAGVGFSAWPYRYPEYQKQWFTEYPDTRIGLPIIGQHTLRGHNDYFQLWAELGLVGLVCMFWLMWIHFRSLRKILIQEPISPLALFAITATLATMTRAFFAFPFHMAAASCLFIANVALVSSQVSSTEWSWSPEWFTQRDSKIRWGMAAGVLILFFILSMQNWLMITADYSARRHGIYNDEARKSYAAGDIEKYNMWKTASNNDMLHSLKLIPDQGKHLHEFGAEFTFNGLASMDEKTLLKAIAYLKRAQKSFGFYRIHEYMGKAYRGLWEITQKPEYLDLSLAEFKEATAIMPTYADGWMLQALLLGKSGRVKESIDLLSNTELRFPGIIEHNLLNIARIEKDIETRTILYDLAASIIPGNEAVLREILLFYLGIERLDRATYMFIQLAQYQENQKMVVEWMKMLLQTQLENKKTQQAVEMMRELRKQPALHSIKELWYYSGPVSWIGGETWAAPAYWAQALEQDVQMNQLEPPLSTMMNHVFTPLVLR